MPRSFKFKMALFSLGTSGAILVVFAALFLSFVHQTGLERLDRHLLMLAENQLRRAGFPDRGARLDESLNALYSEAGQRRFLLQILGSTGQLAYASARWPAGLNLADQLPPPRLDALARGDLEPPPEHRREGVDAFDPQPPRGRPDDAPDLQPDRQPGLRPSPPPRHLPSGEAPGHGRMGRPLYKTASADGTTWRFVAVRSPNATVLLGANMADFFSEVRRAELAFAVVVPIGLILLASGAWLVARQALRPVQTLVRVAAGITAKGLEQRVPAEDADQEFHALIRVINDMLDRLERSFRQAARFSADAAHELKTPLTILQGQLSQALGSAPLGSSEQRTYADLLEEVQRLKTIVRKLLLLAQSDAGQLRLTLKAVDLSAELEALFEDLPLLAPGLQMTHELAPGVRVAADPDLLRQVLQNLLNNAVKYNREGGTLACTLRTGGGCAALTVANTVSGDMAIDRDRLFERFYRGDSAHGRHVDGQGLGLSLAREISRAHGGDLAVEDARDGWIAFRLELPLAAASSPDGDGAAPGGTSA